MSQDFKLKFDEMRESKPAGSQIAEGIKLNDLYDIPGNVRNLCFVWPDGRMKFLNYAYLYSVEYSPNNSSILLTFTSEKITITGTRLTILFNSLLTHAAKSIKLEESRYSSTENNSFTVSDIQIEKND